MTNPAPLFTPHLHPGEQLLWSASYSSKLRSADRARARLRMGLFAVASGGVALLAAFRLAEVLTSEGDPSLAAAVLIPLYAAFGLAAGCLAVFMLLRMKLPPAHADHYAATNLRLLALDHQGRIAAQMPGAVIGGAAFDNPDRPRELHIYPNDDTTPAFFIEHLANLRTARARITDIFPETET